MDIPHISALIEMLASLGFSSSTGRALLFNACLRQKSFTIKEQMCFGEDTISYQLYFKEDASKKLICSYYDATLRKAVEIPASLVNEIDLLNLEKRMRAINWQITFDANAAELFNVSDKNTWKQEATIEEITRDLEKLSITAEGAAVANTLKYKFWTDPLLQSTILDLPALKSRYELSQRFYVINGSGITIYEAYRFLNNRWMERQIHANNRLLRQNEIEQKEAKAVTKVTSEKSEVGVHRS